MESALSVSEVLGVQTKTAAKMRIENVNGRVSYLIILATVFLFVTYSFQVASAPDGVLSLILF